MHDRALAVDHLDVVERLAEELRKLGEVLGTAHDVVVRVGCCDRPDRRVVAEYRADPLVHDGRANLQLQRDGAGGPGRADHIIPHRPPFWVPLPALRTAQELPHVSGCDVGNQAA